MQKSQAFVTPIQSVRPNYIPNSPYNKNSLNCSQHTQFLRNLKSLEYQPCIKENHYGELKSRICIDQNCPSNQQSDDKGQQKYPLICCICQENDHKDHYTLPLKNFFESFYNRLSYDGQPSKNINESICSQDQKRLARLKNIVNPFYYTHQIDQRKIDFVKKIRWKTQQIVDYFRQLEVIGLRYYDILGEQIVKILKTKDNLSECLSNEIRNQSSSIKINAKANKQEQNSKAYHQRKRYSNRCLQDFLKHSLDNISLDEQYNFSIKNQLDNLLNDANQRDKKFLSISNSMIKNIKDDINKINEIYQRPTKLLKAMSCKFVWDTQNKPNSMIVDGLKITQSMPQTNGQRFVLAKPNFQNIKSNRPIAWAFKIVMKIGWVGVGMCLYKKVVFQKNYSFSYTSTGHGSYLISFNGYSWSHSQAIDNSMLKVFNFNTGDIINICYDRFHKKIKFCKGAAGNQGKYSMSVVDAPIDDYFCPCVNLCSNGDSVQIIENMGKIDWQNGW